jgi:hypothetical protein
LCDEDLSFFHIEFSVAVGVGTVDKEGFKKCFTVSFD